MQRCVEIFTLFVGLPERVSLPASKQTGSSEQLYGTCSFFVNNCLRHGIYNKENGFLLEHKCSYLQGIAVKCFLIVSWKYNYGLLLKTCTSCNCCTTTVHLHKKFILYPPIAVHNLNHNHSKHSYTSSITTQSVHQLYSYSTCLQLHTISALQQYSCTINSSCTPRSQYITLIIITLNVLTHLQ